MAQNNPHVYYEEQGHDQDPILPSPRYGHNESRARMPQNTLHLAPDLYNVGRYARPNDQSWAYLNDSDLYPGGQDDLQANSVKANAQIMVSPAQSYNTFPLSSGNEAPWAILQSIDNVPRFTVSNESSITRPHAPSFTNYREPPRSIADSQFTGPPQDSGYATRTKSMVSADDNNISVADDGQSVLGSVVGMHLGADQTSSFCDGEWPQEQTRAATAALQTCPVAECGDKRPMNPSEHKKHMQKHDKPWKCDRGCARKEGFMTRNDLDRHKKSVHNILPANTSDRSYICQGDDCKKKSKVWPRGDNFRAHCLRLHKNEDLEELVKKSEVKAPLVGILPNSDVKITALSEENDESFRRMEERPPDDLEITFENASNILMGIAQGSTNQGQPCPNEEQSGRLTISSKASNASANEQGSKITQIPNAEESSSTPLMSRKHSRQPSIVKVPELFPSLPQASTGLPQGNGTPTLRSSRSNEMLPEYLEDCVASEATPHVVNISNSYEKAEELAAMLTKDVMNCIVAGQEAPEQLRSVISARVIDFLNLSKSSQKRSREDARFEDDSHHSSDSPPSKRISCSVCSKTMDRKCDLKKHEKRHSRPWGCTSEGCNKTFGSKNDWKRHENSQHYQLETWRCHFPDPNSKINQCARTFFRKDSFLAHLRKDHEIKDEVKLKDESRNNRIGRNWQSGFWCGFCKEILRLQKKGLEAWDERFNHIDDVHFKAEKKCIDDWYPLDKDIPKGELRQEHHRWKVSGSRRGDNYAERRDIDGSLDQDSDDDDDRSEYESHGHYPPLQQQKQYYRRRKRSYEQLRRSSQQRSDIIALPNPPLRPSSSATPQDQQQPTTAETAPISVENKIYPKNTVLTIKQLRELGSEGRRFKYSWHCCRCKFGPHNPLINTSCLSQDCSHQACNNCVAILAPAMGRTSG